MLHANLFELIQAIGYLGVFAIVFAETGLLLGFFLPGDSLLFTAGILASQGYFNLPLLLILTASAAIIGDSVGYAIGYKIGPRIFSKEDSLLFSKSHIARAQNFFKRHGPKTIIISRFVPIIRTFAPTLAGVGKMNYAKFLAYNIIGGLLWGVGLTLLGYWLGKKVPNIDKYLLPVIGVIILISISPYLKAFITDAELRKKTIGNFKQVWKKFISGQIFKR